MRGIDVVIATPDQVTPDWLTIVLARDGALTAGRVAAVESVSDSGNWSANATLTVRYSEEARGTLPSRLFLKMVSTDLEDEFFGDSEVTYYTRDYVDVEDAPLLRCYHAAFSEAEQRYHLLLDDVSESHVVGWKKAATLGYVMALAGGLSAMHARWWGAARLAQAGMPVHDATHIGRFVQIAAPGVDHILERFSGELEAHWPQLIREVYARHPQALIRRTADPRGFTLIHGDAGPHNILVPRDGDRPIYIIDRQPFNWSLTSWLGVYDLVYATLFDWQPHVRRQFELPLLQRYHQQLLSRGVGGDYSWEQLYDDYRLCVPMGIYVATEYCRGGINEPFLHVWLPMLKRTLVACEELRCSELW